MLGVIGGALDQRQGLEHRVVDVGRHVGPLLGRGTRLALGDEVPDQAQPPGAEDDDGRGNDEEGATHGPQRGDGGVALDQDGDPRRPDEHTQAHPGDQPAATLPVPVGAQQGHDVFVDERLLGVAGVSPDEDDDADGEEGRPAEEADERDVQGAGDELHGDQQRNQDGGDRPDAAAVRMARE